MPGKSQALTRPRAIDKLTLKQRKFVEAYMGEANGNATRAATLAGYAGGYDVMVTIGVKNMANAMVREAIEDIVQEDPLVASRKERQRLLTSIMNSPTEATKDRLKALELLGKMQADFVERREVVSEVDVQHRHAVDLSKATDEELAMMEKVLSRLSS